MKKTEIILIITNVFLVVALVIVGFKGLEMYQTINKLKEKFV